jgi:hypothetical protein
MRTLLIATTLALLAVAGPALAAGKTSGKKVHKSDKVTVCDGLVEKRLALSIEIESLDSRVAEKNKAIREIAEQDANDLPAVDVMADAEVVDLTAPDEQTAAHRERLAKIVTLQNEIVTLDESRLALERKASRVSSTLSQQSCPK